MEATKPHLETTEAELIQRACQGNKEAFYSLVRPCEGAVYTIAVSILNNPEDAEEVVQEAVLKALSHLAEFRGEAKFSTWLIQITIYMNPSMSNVRVRTASISRRILPTGARFPPRHFNGRS
jgi:RNA polymerase sigma-70 factor (ECF subfamily)